MKTIFFLLFMIIPVTLGNVLPIPYRYCPKLGKDPPMVLIERATVYQAVPKQTNHDNFTTASGFKLNYDYNHKQYRIIAVSRDLLETGFVSYGDSVRVIGTGIYDGIWYVEDTMNRRYTRSIDFLVNLDTPNFLWNQIILINETNKTTDS